MVYQFDSEMAPDDAFEPGTLRHLVAGNCGRLLDPRRTPIRVIELLPEVASFVLEVTAFEDAGARWQVPFETVDHYQFERGSARLASEQATRFGELARRFDKPLIVPARAGARQETKRLLEGLVTAASVWLARNSAFLASGQPLEIGPRQGYPALHYDVQRYFAESQLDDMEAAFATRYVRNPRSGELVKGHRLVLAEMGLVRFEGRVVRDRHLFAGRWSKERRRKHILRRLAFVRALFGACDLRQVVAYRGLSCDGQLRPPRNRTFVSASFSLEVATSHFDPPNRDRSGVLMRQLVPIERLFMTHLETSEMNEHYREAEAVLLFEPGNRLF